MLTRPVGLLGLPPLTYLINLIFPALTSRNVVTNNEDLLIEAVDNKTHETCSVSSNVVYELIKLYILLLDSFLL